MSIASPATIPTPLERRASERAQIAPRDGIWTRATLVRLVLVLCLIPAHLFAPNLGLLLRGFIEVWLVFEARYSNLIPLAVNTLYWQSFRQSFMDLDSGAGVMSDATGLEGYAYLAGIAAMVARFLLFRSAHSADNPIRRIDGRFMVFCILVALGVFSSLRGYVAGTRGWSTNLRSTMTVGAFFYGAMLGTQYDARYHLARAFCVPVGLALYQAINLGFIQSRLAWTLAPFVSASAVYSLFLPLGPGQWLCAIGAFANSLEETCLSSLTSTITLLSLWFSGAAAGAVAALRRFSGLPHFRILLLGLVLASVFMPIVIVQTLDTAQWTYVSRQQDFFGYVRMKLFGDRGQLWAWAFELFRERPFFDKLIAPSGTAIRDRVYLENGRMQTITMGAHNVYLECIFTMGILPGTLLILFLLHNAWSVIKGIAACGDADIAMLGYGSVAILLVGGFTGMFMIHQDGGTWFYLLTGLVVGASARLTAPAEKRVTIANSIRN